MKQPSYLMSQTEKVAMLNDLAKDVGENMNPPATDVLVLFWDRKSGTMQSTGTFKNPQEAHAVADMVEAYIKGLRQKFPRA